MEVTESEALRNALNEMLKIEDAIFAASGDVVTDPMKLRHFSLDGERLRNECQVTDDVRLTWGILFADATFPFVPRPYVSFNSPKKIALISIAREPNGQWIVTVLGKFVFSGRQPPPAFVELDAFCARVQTGSVISEAEVKKAAGIFARCLVFCLQKEI